MLVTLSINRCVATSTSFSVRSRLADTRYVPSSENVVSSTQSLCAPWNSTCFPVAASTARTVLSLHPNASLVPSGDQLTPFTVSNVTGCDHLSDFLATSQTWISPNRDGVPPATASDLPSGENATAWIRSDSPTSRATRADPSALCKSTS